MSYKTLILIDNTNEMTTLNREIIKETIKCFIKDADREDKVAIAVTGEKAEYLTDYDDSLNTQLKTVESIEFQDVNAPGADVLMEVLLSWKESDVAFRDILYISCRGVALGSDYSEEELLFEVNSKQYPIYTLACAQNENASFIKGMSSLSRISGGVSVSTEDAQSDAEVEKQLSEMLHKAIEEKRKYEQEEAEKSSVKEDEMSAEQENTDEETETAETGTDENTDDTVAEITEEELSDVYMSESDEQVKEVSGVIYDRSDELNDSSTFPGAFYPAVAFIFVLIIFSVSFYFKNKKNSSDEKKQRNEFKEKLNRDKKKEPFEDVFETETVCLSSMDDDESDTGTRLLFQTKEGIDITLEDRANPTKYFRACVRDAIVIGRSDKICDIPITYDDSVSARHCEICKRDGELYCRDLGSSNGTMINQQKIYQEVKIENGDILRIGRLSFFVQIVGDNYGK